MGSATQEKLLESGKWSASFDGDGNITELNYDRSYCYLQGYRDQEALLASRGRWEDAVHPDDREEVVALVADAMGKHPEGMDFDAEYRMLTSRGYRYFHDFVRFERDSDGRPVKCNGVLFDIEDNLTMEYQLRHEQLRGEVMSYMVDREEDPIEILKHFAEPLRELIDCDQVIYRDLEETRIMVNSPAIEDEWHVPIEYCQQCQHFDAHHPMYAGGFTEMDNCQKGWQGIPVYEHCPIKSSLTRIVYCDGEIAGYLAIHYVKKYHTFTDIERSTLEEFTRILSLALSRYRSRLLSSQVSAIRKSMNMTFALASEYDPVIVIDPRTGSYEWFNTKAPEIERDTSMSVHGENLYANIEKDAETVIHEEDRAQFRAFYTKENLLGIAETGIPQETENRWFVKGENRYRWKYNKAVRMTDDQGNVFIVVGVIDTTEKKEKELAFESQKIQHQEDVEMIVGLASEYVSLYYINLEAHRFTVYSIDEGKISDTKQLLEQDTDPFALLHRFAASPVVHPEDREQFLGLSTESVRKRLEHSKRFSMRFRRDYGSGWRWSEMDVIKYEGKDETANSIAIGFADRDLEIRSEIEHQQQLKEALSMAQSASRAKTTFLNNMSHDIRTPMNAIIGYAGLAASHIDRKEQVQDYLQKIAQSSDHLLSLINDVLDMSRIESGKMNIEEREENLSEIIHTLRDIVQSDIHTKQLDFFVDAVGVRDENVMCDRLRLNQVLLNIISNAIKYTPAGGTVSMRVMEKKVNRNGYSAYEFTVRDNGMGMSREFLKTIFDPFTRVKSTTVSGIQGTGLGMAITKNIVDMMGGKIEVESELGKGTTVTVSFDFRLTDARPKEDIIPELKGVRALVVDDDSNTCLSVANMLRDIGMRDEWCLTGKEAVIRAGEAFRRGDSFRLMIIDWLMPDMNGIETVRRIRKVIGDDVPIIILTAYDWSDIEPEAREAGVTAFVSKPMFPSDLHRVLNRCLGHAKEEEKPVEKTDFKGKKVLIAEDNALNLEIATALLEEFGCTVISVEDGAKALKCVSEARKGDFDLILMDIQMPEMDGYEATRKIRALGTEISKIPIVAMTANAFEEDRREALESGMNEHLAKPIDIARLKAILSRFLA